MARGYTHPTEKARKEARQESYKRYRAKMYREQKPKMIKEYKDRISKWQEETLKTAKRFNEKWTAKEITLLKELRKKGYSYRQVGLALGRSYHGCRAVLLNMRSK